MTSFNTKKSDYYPNTRQTIDRYNQVINKIYDDPNETYEEEDEFLHNFCLHLAHALIKDTGYGQESREELGKIADIINDVIR